MGRKGPVSLAFRSGQSLRFTWNTGLSTLGLLRRASPLLMVPPVSDTLTARREVLAVALVTLVGMIVRLAGLGRLGLSHFDEGAYASVGLWVSLPGGLAGMDPDVLSYAPPGFLALVGVSYLVLGFQDLAAIMVSELAALATIPLTGWLGRRVFGPGAGVAAAALAAFSGAHVAFSRMALTDALFLLGWIAVMAAGLLFLKRPGVGRALLLGLSVGVAQNLKYNGWLSVIVVGLAAVGVCSSRGGRF